MYHPWGWWWILGWFIPTMLIIWMMTSANGRNSGRPRTYFGVRRYRDPEYYGAHEPGPPAVGGHRGHGPRDYVRSDARILEEVSDRLMVDDEVDARQVDVRVNAGVVTLSGAVASRGEKRLAEVIAESTPGVTDVQNGLRIGAPVAGTAVSTADQRVPSH